MSQTYGSKSKRYIIQRDEWLRGLQVKLTPAIERVLREFYKASIIAHEQRGDLNLEYCFKRLLDMFRMWNDDRIVEVIGEHNASEANICLQQAVKCHATILSLSTASPCKQQLEVPNINKFFRMVVESTVTDLSEMRSPKEGGISVFGSTDTSQRKRTRAWIDQIVLNKCLGVVPIGIFARSTSPPPHEEEEEEELTETIPEEKPVVEEIKPVAEVKPVVEEIKPVAEVKPVEVVVEVMPVVEVKPVAEEVKSLPDVAEKKKKKDVVEVKVPAKRLTDDEEEEDEEEEDEEVDTDEDK